MLRGGDYSIRRLRPMVQPSSCSPCANAARQYQALSREASTLLCLGMGHDPPAQCRLADRTVARPRSAPPVLLRLAPPRLRTLGSCSPVGRAPGAMFRHDALESREPTQAPIDRNE
jgi:anti-sigma factor RsiW